MPITNRYYWMIVCLFFLLPLKSQAGAWVSIHSRVGNQYIGSFSWPDEDNDTIRLCTASSCIVAICHFSDIPDELCGNPSFASTNVIVPNGATAKKMRDLFVAKNAISGNWATTTLSQLRAKNTCFGVMYWQGTHNANFTGKVIPGSYCGAVPPMPETCDITGNVNINYGAINQNNVNGAIKSAPLYINCTARTSIKLTLAGSRNIELGQGGRSLTSTLKVSQQDLANGVSLIPNVGNNTFMIESTLHTTGLPEVGDFNGSGVIIMSYL